MSSNTPSIQNGYRIMGSEIEFGAKPISAVSVATENLLFSVTPPGFTQRCLLNHSFLPNGGQWYRDTNYHPELASSECLGFSELVLFETAGVELVADGLKRFREKTRLNLRLFKSNRNYEFVIVEKLPPANWLSKDTWGSHANYLTFRRIPFKLFSAHLLPLIVSRSPLIGNAWLTLARDLTLRFVFSQRAGVLSELGGDVFSSGATTRTYKPMLNIRDEPHADAEIWRRLHDISGDSNMSEWQIFLKYAVFDLVLAMIEEDEFLKPFPAFSDQSCRNYDDAVLRFNSDIRFKSAIRMEDGKSYSALDFQRWFFEQAVRFFIKEERAPLTPERKLGLESWGKILDALERWDLCYLARYLDWAAILYYFIQPAVERLGFNPESLFWSESKYGGVPYNHSVGSKKRGKSRALTYFSHFIIEYACIETEKSPYGYLLRNGRMERFLSPNRVAWAKVNPPPQTRANWRMEIFNWNEALPKDQKLIESTASWAYVGLSLGSPIYSPIVVFPNLDPYRNRVSEEEWMLLDELIHRKT